MPFEGLPQWYQDEPEDVNWSWWYQQAFWDLSTERQIGMAIGPIPHSRILSYGERKGLDPGMIDVFSRVIREMDSAYLKWTAK